jgi:hypothetical protein
MKTKRGKSPIPLPNTDNLRSMEAQARGRVSWLGAMRASDREKE